MFPFLSVRQRVLSQKTHELDLGEKGVLELVVSLPDEPPGATKDNTPEKETAPQQVGSAF